MLWIVTVVYVTLAYEYEGSKIPSSVVTSVYSYKSKEEAKDAALSNLVDYLEVGATILKSNGYYGEYAVQMTNGNMLSIDVHQVNN